MFSGADRGADLIPQIFIKHALNAGIGFFRVHDGGWQDEAGGKTDQQCQAVRRQSCILVKHPGFWSSRGHGSCHHPDRELQRRERGSVACQRATPSPSRLPQAPLIVTVPL